MTTTVTTVQAVREAVAAARAQGRRIALVPTMGALHAGHLALVERARTLADLVVVSVFVNPLQFGAGEDLDRYPRDLPADEALLATAGADLVFAPSPDEVYPDGPPQTRVTAGEAGRVLEGAVRPGHFDGVLTVVAKLLHMVGPDVAVFGAKDAQQAFLVRRMVADLDLPVTIDVVDTVREDDGLARSSRNAYLDPADRLLARAVPGALDAAEAAAPDPDAMAAAAAASVPDGVALDYLAVVDPASFLPVGAGYRGDALVLVAARVGGTRLIDNRTVRLERPAAGASRD